jgi:hypothetical protein
MAVEPDSSIRKLRTFFIAATRISLGTSRPVSRLFYECISV